MKTIKHIMIFILSSIALLHAELTTANILPYLTESINSFNYLQTDIRKYQGSDMQYIPATDEIVTGDYYFTRQGISGNYTARIEYNYLEETDITKITNSKIYKHIYGGDYYIEELQERIFTEIYPGFETYLFSLIKITSLEQITADNYLATANIICSSNYEMLVLHISGNMLIRLDYYVTGDVLAKTVYLEYSTGSDIYLKKVGYPIDTNVNITEYLLPSYTVFSDEKYDFSPTEDTPDDDNDNPDPDEWLPGHNVKFQEGADLSPFASYGAAGEEVPGHSGALQLAYTDLVLPGINGLDFVLKRSYLSQQMHASPKPNSFKNNPFKVDYPAGDSFLDEYKLIAPDGWGGWMGHGWQTNIGGELYVNEIRTFAVGGPLFPPIGDANMAATLIRSYTFQTADGQRGDFFQEDEQERSVRILGIASLSSDYDMLKYYRNQLETEGRLDEPGRFAEPVDKRMKMKLEKVSENHYVVYTANGTKYYFTLQIFDKEATWQKEYKAGTAFNMIRSFISVEFKTKVFYLTKIEDVNGNTITVGYEKLFDEVKDSGARQKTQVRDNTKWEFMKVADLYDGLLLIAGTPKTPGLNIVGYAQLVEKLKETGEFVLNTTRLINNAWNAYENESVFEIFGMRLLNGLYAKYLTIPVTQMVLGAYSLVPGMTEGNMYEIPMKLGIFAASQYLMNAEISDIRYKSKIDYSVVGYRPNKITDTIGRIIDLVYVRNGYDPNDIGDSQIRYVKYKDVNGNNTQIEYIYDSQGFLTGVKYPEGNPISYEYRIYDYGKLLRAVNHPSGFRSEYEYRWFQPKADVTTLGSRHISDDENKRWSYYIVTQKTHSGNNVEPRLTRYEYRDGTFYNLSKDADITARRWYFQRHNIVDPLEQNTRKDYTFGMLEAIHYPTLNAGTKWETHHRILNEYDFGNTNLLTHTMVLKNTSMKEKFYEYDEFGQPVKITDMGYHTEDVEMGGDTDQRITYITYDNRFNTLNNPVNIYGLISEQYTIEPSRNAANKYGHIKREYDNRGRMTKDHKYYTDTNYITDSYNYDNYGNVTTHIDPKGNQTLYTYQYNAYPKAVERIVNSKTFKTEADHSPHTGVLLSSKDENDYIINYTYDKLNRKTKEAYPDNTYIQTNYLDAQYRTEVTDRKNRKTIYNYNPYGELKTITDPLNHTTTYKTDKLGRLDAITLADNRQYKYNYDEVNRPTRITYPDGTYSEKVYEDGNNSIIVYDENQNGFEYWYDANNNLTRIYRGDIRETGLLKYDYNFNYLTTITSPMKYTTIFENDLLGRRLRKTQPDNTYETYEYDSNSNLTKHTNYENKQIKYTYDTINRLTTETYPDSQYNVQYEYDNGTNALGRVTKITDKSGTAEFKYNNMGLITEETKRLDGTNYTTKYNYDSTGLLLSIDYPQVNGQNINVQYEYDELYRIKAMKLNNNTVITNTYDNTGRLTQKVYGNGTKEIYKYDSKDRLIEQEARASAPLGERQIFLYKYTYDAAGNMTQRDITDSNVLRRRDSYEYDRINQLRKVWIPGDRDIELTYDRHLNRQYMTHGFGTITYNYNTTMNQLTEYKEDTGDGYTRAFRYTYDKQGNPTMKKYVDIRAGQNREVAQETYNWNDRDELTQITGRVTENYTYDYRGLRHIKETKNNGQNNTYKYIYLQSNQPIFKYNTSENYYDVYVYEGTKRMALMRLRQAQPPVLEYLINNYQGSPVAVLSTTGDVKYQKYLDPWGNMEMEIGSPSSDIEFQYTDKEYSDDTELYYFQARYYDPKTNHFMRRDRVTLESNPGNYFGLNTYLFVNNNPMKYTDSDGNIIKVVGTSEYKTNVVKNLNELSGFWGNIDSNGIYNVTGPSKYGNASDLMTELVNAPETIAIQRTSIGGDGYSPGLRAIYFSAYDSPPVIPTKMPNGQVNDMPSPSKITLGHELIHAQHDLQGSINNGGGITPLGDGRVIPNVYKGLDKNGNAIYGSSRSKAFIEEFRTVGVGGYNKLGDITENMLRQDHGLGIRVDY